ncbi:MAG TPA: lysozyme inhibitor LprI family protein [Acidobacteriaceae bacterium]|nr:lysozyme inhibitor LprI family protein [Acidobacteriaceae bacterium]
MAFHRGNVRRISILAIFIASSTWLCSGAAGQMPRCNDSGTQSELDVRAFDAAQREDAALANERKAVLAALDAHPDEQKLLRTAETEWDAFHKAQMAALYPLAQINPQIYGSIMPMCFGRDRQDYTKAHEEELHWMRPSTSSCPAVDAEAADKELNGTYQQLLAKLGDDSYARKALIEAERAWIPYRDAMLAALVAVHPDQTGACHRHYAAKIAKRRTRDLDAMLHPEEGDVCEYDHPISKDDLEIYGIKEP